MISFNYELDFKLDGEIAFSDWISKVISSELKNEGEINYIFCDDNYLVEINQQYLDHDTLTDIISFDYTIGECQVVCNPRGYPGETNYYDYKPLLVKLL